MNIYFLVRHVKYQLSHKCSMCIICLFTCCKDMKQDRSSVPFSVYICPYMQNYHHEADWKDWRPMMAEGDQRADQFIHTDCLPEISLTRWGHLDTHHCKAWCVSTQKELSVHLVEGRGGEGGSETEAEMLCSSLQRGWKCSPRRSSHRVQIHHHALRCHCLQAVLSQTYNREPFSFLSSQWV